MPTRNRIIEADDELDDDTELSSVVELDDEGDGETHYSDSDDTTTDDIEEMEADENTRARARGGRVGKKGVSSRAKADKNPRHAKDEDLEWKEGTSLEAPKRRPGYVQRWVRYSLMNEDDPKNWSRMTRSGWTPRPLNTVPKGFNPPTIQHSRLGTLISVGDLILCEMDERRFASRKKFFRMKHQRQIAAIEKRPQQDAERLGGPGIQVGRKSSVTFGRGQRKARATS